MDFVGKRFWFFLISLLVITPGVIFLIIAPGLRPGIDFTGGSSMTLQFQESSSVTQQEMREALSNHGYSESTVQNLGNNSFFVRTKQLDEEAKDSLVEGLTTSLAPGSGDVLQGFDLVSPVVAQETVLNAFWAVLAAALESFSMSGGHFEMSRAPSDMVLQP